MIWTGDPHSPLSASSTPAMVQVRRFEARSMTRSTSLAMASPVMVHQTQKPLDSTSCKTAIMHPKTTRASWKKVKRSFRTA